MKHISPNGVNLIKSFEGLRLEAYKPVKTEKYWSIGYGHYGADVKAGQKITLMHAELLLLQDLKRFEANVNSYDNRYRWTQNEYDALVSFAYNIGSINQLTANGRRSKAEIADAMMLYVKAGKKTLPGLVARRTKERALYVQK